MALRRPAKLREISNIPVILLTAKSEDTDKILGLTIGADDYVTKPLHPIEVGCTGQKSVAAIYHVGGDAHPKSQCDHDWRRVTLDDDSKRVTVDGDTVNLTPIEYSILHLLMQNAGKSLLLGQNLRTGVGGSCVWKFGFDGCCTYPAFAGEN